MRITDIIKEDKVQLSIEVFPPKADTDYHRIKGAIDSLSRLNPPFMSVTYGAGGSNALYSAKIAKYVKSDLNTTPLAHLTCIGATKENIDAHLDELKQGGIENILALRGDIPPVEGFKLTDDFTHASDLLSYIRGNSDFCLGGACYPEGHMECDRRDKDIDNLKIKIDAGAEYLLTQMFFDNEIFYNFVSRARSKGITTPIIPGLMPITSGKQIKRMCELSGATIPHSLKNIVEKYDSNPDAMMQAGIAYATNQIIDLVANGFNLLHICSMNKPSVAQAIYKNVSEIIK